MPRVKSDLGLTELRYLQEIQMGKLMDVVSAQVDQSQKVCLLPVKNELHFVLAMS